MATLKSLEQHLRKEHDLVVGEMTLREFKKKVFAISKKKIKVSGRSWETGRKKTVHVPFYKVLYLIVNWRMK